MIRDIPNILTVTRIAMIPVLVVSFYMEGVRAQYVTAGIFIFASITDYIDGILARRWRAQTTFGRILDPIADKMLVVATFRSGVASRSRVNWRLSDEWDKSTTAIGRSRTTSG